MERVPIPWAAVPAAVVELILFATMTLWPRRVPARWLPAALIASGILPYLALPGDRSLVLYVAALASFPVLWFLVAPRSRAWDMIFAAAMVAMYLSNAFELPFPGKLEILGKSMWLRLGLMGTLFVAKEPGIDFGFWPNREHWRIGAQEYLLFLIPGFGLGYLLGYFRSPDIQILKGIGMFFGSLWFITVGEEFLFRGLIQRWIGLAAGAVLYGLSHLSFRTFPNWKHVAITILLGYFCGRAFRKAQSVRAAMVTHALVNATWVGFLGKA